MDSKQSGAPDPLRVFSGGTGEGGLASLTPLSIPERPTPQFSAGRAQGGFRKLALFAKKLYIFGVSAAVATVFLRRDELWRRDEILVVDNEAASSALAKDAAKNRMALALVFTLWSVAARCDIALWVGRAPCKLNLADMPSR